MHKRISLIVIIMGSVLGIYSPIYAQGSLIKAGKQTMKANSHIGRNLEFGLRAIERRMAPASLHVEKLVNHAVTTSKIVPLNYVQSFPIEERATALTQLKIPGFYANSFRAQWEHYCENSTYRLNNWSQWLEEAYAPETKFEGYFVPSMKEILNLSSRPVRAGVSAKRALENAFTQATKQQHGFLVIAVAGNNRRAKDVLVMDLERDRWLSLNRSRGQALAMHFGSLLWMFHGENLYLSTVLGKQGILVREVQLPEAGMEVSFNGLVWTKYSLNSAVGRDLLLAARNQLTIEGNYKTKSFQFSIQEGDPVFSTASEALLWKQAREENIPFQLTDEHLKVFFPEKGYENIYVFDENRRAVPAAGQPVTLRPYDDLNTLEIMEFIKYKSTLAEPNRPLLYHRIKGDILDPDAYVEYLSKDLRFTSDQLEEIKAFERLNGIE